MTKNKKQKQKKINKLNDEAVNKLLEDFQMVSSKQLAQILSKPNDNSLRVARCENRGFSWYKHEGTVYYNLPEVMREIKVGVNA